MIPWFIGKHVAVPHAFTGGVDSRVGGREAYPGGSREGHGKLPGDGRGDDVSHES